MPIANARNKIFVAYRLCRLASNTRQHLSLSAYAVEMKHCNKLQSCYFLVSLCYAHVEGKRHMKWGISGVWTTTGREGGVRVRRHAFTNCRSPNFCLLKLKKKWTPLRLCYHLTVLSHTAYLLSSTSLQTAVILKYTYSCAIRITH
jgi:hypothetical protein